MRLGRPAVRSAALVSAGRATSAALTFALGLVVARLYGAEGTGLLYMSVAVASVGGTIASVGLPDPLLRHVVLERQHDRNARALLAGGGLVIVLGATVTMAVGVPVVHGVVADRQYDLVAWSVLAIPGFALSLALNRTMAALGRPVTGELLTKALGQAVLIIWLVVVEHRSSSISPGVVGCFTIPALLGVLLVCHATRHPVPSPSARTTLQWSRRLAADGAPLLMATSMGMLPQWIDIFIVNHYRGPAASGVYSVAVRIAALIGLLLVGPRALASPRFALMHQNNDLVGLQRLVTKINLALAIGSSILLVIVWLFSERVLGFFGSAFEAGRSVLLIASVGQVVHCAFGLTLVLLIMSGRGRYVLVASGVALVSNVALNLLLVPRHGIAGAAVASLAATTATNIVAGYYVWKFLKIRPLMTRPPSRT